LLGKKTQAILSDLAAISTAAIIRYPITGIQDSNKSMVAFIDLSQFGEEEFDEFGIFNLSELLSILGVLDNASVEINDEGVIKIANDDSSIKYFTTNIDLLSQSFSANPKIPENIKAAPTAMNFIIESSVLEKLKKTSGLMKLEHLVVENSDEDINLTITGVNKDSSNNYKVKVNGTEANGNHKIVLDMENIKKLPAGNYNVKIAQNTKTKSYITMFTSKDIPSLEVVINVVSE
jgi:hypothetical protein